MTFPGTIPLPRALITAIQDVSDIIIGVVGQDCKLYQYSGEAADNIYGEGVKNYAAPVSTKAVIHWGENLHKLKNLGIMVEDSVPLMARLKFADEVQVHSIITIPYEFYRGSGQDYGFCFEIVDRKYFGQDIEAKIVYVLAPVRDYQNLPGEIIADLKGRV